MLTRNNVEKGTYGEQPEERAIEKQIRYGMVNIDKPSGPTSHQVSSYIQDMLDISKAGHAGTLDPNVTGVLPTALGDATRINHSLLKAPKEYVCHMQLHENVTQSDLDTKFDTFTGEIEQLPPVRSAVKREERERTVYYIEQIERDGNDILMKVGCEAGTYVRKLCHDIGESLGTGAHMADLRRTQVGPFTEESLTTLQELQEAAYLYEEEADATLLESYILPVETGVEHLQKVVVLDSAVTSLTHGASLKVPGVAQVTDDIEEDMLVAVKTLQGELVETGIAQMNSEEMVTADSGVAVTPKQVFMHD